MNRTSPSTSQVVYQVRCGTIGAAVLFGTAILAAGVFADDDQLDGRSARRIISRPVSEISTDIRIEAKDLPADRSGNLFKPPEPYSLETVDRLAWPEIDFTWESPEFLYQPTYFNEVPLERYGQTRSRLLQPTLSGIHFFGHTALMPYKLLVNHPYGYISPLGYYRVGSPAPELREKLPWGIDPRWLHPYGHWLYR